MNKREIQAVVCDLDGTLLTSKKKILNETRNALIELQERGIKLILASSRTLFMLEEIIDSLQMRQHNGYAVCQNGLVTVDLSNAEIQEFSGISDSQALEIFDYFKRYRHLGVFESEKGFQIHIPIKLRWAMPIYYYIIAKKKYSDMRNITFTLFGDFRFSPDQKIEIIHKRDELTFPVSKAGYIRLTKGMDKMVNQLNENFCELDIIRISRAWADIMPKGINKAHGINSLSNKLGFGFENMIVFGDAENDIEMIKSARLGIAMGNAMQKVKQNADDITLSNNENGIAHALKKYGLIE
ncbi:MAG: HAD family hydrolase [Erysipelothrix sp.]|nr:HAD family hydrolase [Erysipelothrix sp.]